jgi:hypothetical protein
MGRIELSAEVINEIILDMIITRKMLFGATVVPPTPYHHELLWITQA